MRTITSVKNSEICEFLSYFLFGARPLLPSNCLEAKYIPVFSVTHLSQFMSMYKHAVCLLYPQRLYSITKDIRVVSFLLQQWGN